MHPSDLWFSILPQSNAVYIPLAQIFPSRGYWITLLLLSFTVFLLYEIVGVCNQFASHIVRNDVRVDANPVFPVLVRWLVGPLIVLTQFGNPLRLTLDGHEIVIGDVEKRKHVAADIKHQYALATFNLGKRKFLLHITQRQTVVAQFFYIQIPFFLLF